MFNAVLATGSTDTSAAWFTLAGVLGGVLLTSAVALTTAILNHRWQRGDRKEEFAVQEMKDLRKEKLRSILPIGRAYYDYAEALLGFLDSKLAGATDPLSASVEEQESKVLTLRTTCGNAVGRLALIARKELSNKVIETQAHLEETVRMIMSASLWGFRTQPPVLTWASMQLVHIRE